MSLRQQKVPIRDTGIEIMRKYGFIAVQVLLTLVLMILAWNINKFDQRLTELEKWRIAQQTSVTERLTRLEENTKEIIRRLEKMEK